MKVNIFLLCYNEQILLPKTIEHYKKNIPCCKITIYDNESTDKSVKIAKKLGCRVISWNSKNQINDFKYMKIKNNCWKKSKGWIIVADMDEWLQVTEEQLRNEKKRGTSVLKVQGHNMIGESKKKDLSDLCLHELEKFLVHEPESKMLCFYRKHIEEMNYSIGAHHACPVGKVLFSETTYVNKHMLLLGEDFVVNKYIQRSKRANKMKKYGIANHYIDNVDEIVNMYRSHLNEANKN